MANNQNEKQRNNNEVTFELMEHIGVLDTYDNREQAWTKEVNIVSWNGGPAKIDIRDWDSSHERMSRGITLTEEQAEKLTAALVDRYRARDEVNMPTPMRDDMAR